MNAKEWREKARVGVDLTLPSGMVIRARRPSPVWLMEWERLPLLFASAGGAQGVTAENAEELARFMRALLVHCCVSPRINPEAAPDAEDEIRPSELPGADWTYIVRWAMRLKEAAAVRPFRGERKDDGGSGDGETVFAETVGAAGNQGPGAGAGDRPGGGAKAGGVEDGRGAGGGFI